MKIMKKMSSKQLHSKSSKHLPSQATIETLEKSVKYFQNQQ